MVAVYGSARTALLALITTQQQSCQLLWPYCEQELYGGC